MFKIRSNQIKFILILLLLVIGIVTLVFNQFLIEKLSEKERSSIELWARAIEYNGTPQNVETREDLKRVAQQIFNAEGITAEQRRQWLRVLDRVDGELANSALDFVATELIIQNRFEVPSVVVNSDMEVLYHRNLNTDELTQSFVEEFSNLNPPIKIIVATGENSETQYVYYGESDTIRLLRVIPYIQILFILIFAGLAYYSWSSIRDSEQSSLWVGMAKEAAHQLGTPLSSLYGWVALIREMDPPEELFDIIHELENDVDRVQKVAERFNKIGSQPELKEHRVGPVLQRVSTYMTKRIPSLGLHAKITTEIESDARIQLNVELFEWAIENLVKNALDALDTRSENATIVLKSYVVEDECIIEVADTGKGIDKKFQKEIFKPGFSTKKRGWGLGLSLTKRIIEEYHRGEITIKESELDVGTTFCIVLPVATKQKSSKTA